VFLLPSLCEGSAAVTYEAMMAGLPVVCTENAGSIIINEKSGFIVPVLDPVSIADSLLRLQNSPELLSKLSEFAHNHSTSVCLSGYSQRLVSALETHTL
jgi:glycosyltransferase involved in cell wall biosynthesis